MYHCHVRWATISIYPISIIRVNAGVAIGGHEVSWVGVLIIGHRWRERPVALGPIGCLGR